MNSLMNFYRCLFIISFLCLILCPIPSIAITIKEQRNQESFKNWPSISETRAAADSGDAQAQFILGEMYVRGEGITADGAEAIKWFRKSAEQGYAPGQYRVGSCYFSGCQGVEKQSDAEAIEWYRKAAEQGYAPAQYELGEMYSTDEEGRTQDENEMVKWWSKAADRGFLLAQKNMGMRYAGLKDYVHAYLWLALVAAQGDSTAIVALDAVTKHMTPAQTAEAQKLVYEWKPVH